MLNRRLLRIKVFQALYGYQQDESRDKKSVLNFLDKSVKHVEDEYIFLLSLPIELRYYVENEQNPEEILYVPTKKDIETGRTFIYNRLISILDRSELLKRKIKQVGINWYNYKDVMRMLFNGFKTSPYFQKYLNSDKKDFDAQKTLMLSFYKDYLPKHEELHNLMEDLFIHWNDDKKAVFNSLVKTIEDLKLAEDEVEVKALSEDFDEDWTFCKDLLNNTIKNEEELTALIQEKTKKWDTERIADIDLILMRMSVSELLYFSNIPIKVSINEYLDISKIYSTPKSSVFLNGILDKLMNEMKAAGKIKKAGRGLVE
ncbi:MAG TPA: transcription antitermination factor NusB [Bacteroidetes bacterium]|nr:transcription antitermination factor NusB [Bacteroidota bacterium]